MIHVHVYKVTKKYECNIDTGDVEAARQKALDLVGEKRLEATEKDCRFVALSFTRPHQGSKTFPLNEEESPSAPFMVVVEKEK